MNSLLYNPLEEYETRLKKLHVEKINKFFDVLVEQSCVNFEEK